MLKMARAAERERILVVDDAPETLELIQRNLAASGYQVLTAPDAVQAIRILDSTAVDLVITDLKMPKVSGLDLVQHVRENFKDTEIMMITGFPTVEGAVEAVKTGSQEYLTKPFTDEELLSAVKRVLEILHARRNSQTSPPQPPSSFGGLIGESTAVQEVFRAIKKAATAKVTILISGESGTGKELAARAIHYSSQRASAPFVPVNCGSIPENLLESELFGHVKGAFTGARESRAGFFQTADGGTIFLDEIGDTSLAMQAKFFNDTATTEIYTVGSSRPQEVDVRVLAATNKDLQKLVENGIFREDLFFRLNVIAISLPPLRERDDDVLQLTSYFISKFAEELGHPVPRFSDKALEVVKKYSWPGNVRELENLVQRLVVMTEGDVIDVPDLPSAMRFSLAPEMGLNRTLAEVEAEHIRNVLGSVGGNKTRAAETLGIDRKTLREKLKNSSTTKA
jgi:DNA-binding NtrC family response regulator